MEIVTGLNIGTVQPIIKTIKVSVFITVPFALSNVVRHYKLFELLQFK